MGVTVSSRVFWTDIPALSYKDKNGKDVNVGKSVAKFVLLAIADNADDFGENSWQSIDTISKKVSLDRRTVIRAIRSLVGAGFLSVAGVTRYGTNDYKINMGVLGEAPKKRARQGRPAGSDSGAITSDSGAETSDSGAITSGVVPPESSLNRSEPPLRGGLSEKQYDQANAKVTAMIDQSLAAGAINLPLLQFERAFGFGTLPWDTTSPWQAMSRFVRKVHTADPTAFGKYVVWRAGDGKYKAMSNKQIRLTPLAFMDIWPEFEAAQPKPHQPAPQVESDYARRLKDPNSITFAEWKAKKEAK